MVSLQGLGKVPLSLFNCPPGSARALLAGAFPLRCCATRFACRTPTWRLPVSGHVVDLVTASVGAVREVVADGGCREVLWVSGSGPGRKRIRLNRKPPCTPRRFGIPSRSRVWKRLCHVGLFSDFIPDRKKRRDDQDDGGHAPAQCRTGVG